VHDRVLHLKTAHNIWLKLCNTYEDSSKIKSSRKDTYNRQYQTFAQKLVNHLMIALLDLSRLSAYVLVVFLHILTMNVTNSCFML
jgi:hypothetical protein